MAGFGNAPAVADASDGADIAATTGITAMDQDAPKPFALGV